MISTFDKRVVQVGAIYDLLATVALAVPISLAYVLSAIQALDEALGFNTRFESLDPTAHFLINLGGCAYVIWALARLRNPGRELARLDAWLRLMVVLCQIWAVIQGATPVLFGLAAILAVIGILEFRQGGPATRGRQVAG
ncbi:MULTISPECIES: hypothetical protein [Burkholderia cepacia complex]|uniref:hypothetical protein n=1 Tax=Burkholderia cepacia complex TaxID=87882 RepID=UPI000A917FFB|nr:MULTISPECIES: hypothetical protein [Burkholderia cepacia complex]